MLERAVVAYDGHVLLQTVVRSVRTTAWTDTNTLHGITLAGGDQSRA
jgi:hypothetical protein